MGNGRKNREFPVVWAIVVLATVLGYFPGGSDDLPIAPMRAGHRNVECSMCHAAIAALDAPATIPVIDGQCRQCHTQLSLQKDQSLLFHAQYSRRCTDCHFFHRPDSVVAAGREFQINTGHGALRATCASCHGPGENLQALSTGHRAAARLFHSELIGTGNLSPSDACLLCHSDGKRPDRAAYGDVPQFDAGHTHPIGVTVMPRDLGGSRIKPIVDRRVRLFDGKMECQTCHSLSSPTQFRLAGFDSREELCRVCHQME